MPTTVSRMIAAMDCGPSKAIRSSRCCRARSHSCLAESEWNGERYGYGPQKCTTPAEPVSEAQRRGSPVRLMAAAVAPWYER